MPVERSARNAGSARVAAGLSFGYPQSMARGVAVLSVLLVFAALFAGSASAALRLVGVASGFNAPVHVASTPSDRGHVYVVEQPGRIMRAASGRPSTVFLDIRDLVQYGGEQGLLSVAFHPGYATNGRLYVNYTDNDDDTQVVEYQANAARTAVNEATRRVIFSVEQTDPDNHNGGQLAFGSNGYLYVGMGDGGGSGDAPNNAQNMSTRLGKLVRIRVADGSWKIVALGLRNPWRFSLDARTDLFFIGDVGQKRREEVDLFRIGNSILENYGWSRWEGTYLYNASRRLSTGTRRDPIHEYSHVNGRCSVTGGIRYRGSTVPSVYGRYFFGDYCTGEVWSFALRDGRKHDLRLHSRLRVPGQLSSFGRGPRGGLYFASHNGGKIYRLGST